MTNIFQRVSPVLATAWVAMQSRLPVLLLTLTSLELTLAMVVGMCVGAIKRRDQVA